MRKQSESSPPPKTCAACGRIIEWRRKWARDWENVRYCSDRCRRGGLTDTDRALEAAILDLLTKRGAGKSICPSEAARLVANSPDQNAWQPLMEPARAAARRLVAAGVVRMTQNGHPIDPSTAKGPVRLSKST